MIKLLNSQRDSRNRITGPEGIDFSLLVDGLMAEREQGITIDVAYRYFESARRRFIVADTPGHEQYTRNMVTGASRAELALLLTDARKGLLRQTRRHAKIAALMGIPRVILAVNKMDLVGFDPEVFRVISEEFSALASTLGFSTTRSIPLSGLQGDNVRRHSTNMPWYKGQLIRCARCCGDRRRNGKDFRMPVQCVFRADPDFRGYAGLVWEAVSQWATR